MISPKFPVGFRCNHLITRVFSYSGFPLTGYGKPSSGRACFCKGLGCVSWESGGPWGSALRRVLTRQPVTSSARRVLKLCTGRLSWVRRADFFSLAGADDVATATGSRVLRCSRSPSSSKSSGASARSADSSWFSIVQRPPPPLIGKGEGEETRDSQAFQRETRKRFNARHAGLSRREVPLTGPRCQAGGPVPGIRPAGRGPSGTLPAAWSLSSSRDD